MPFPTRTPHGLRIPGPKKGWGTGLESGWPGQGCFVAEWLWPSLSSSFHVCFIKCENETKISCHPTTLWTLRGLRAGRPGKGVRAMECALINHLPQNGSSMQTSSVIPTELLGPCTAAESSPLHDPEILLTTLQQRMKTSKQTCTPDGLNWGTPTPKSNRAVWRHPQAYRCTAAAQRHCLPLPPFPLPSPPLSKSFTLTHLTLRFSFSPGPSFCPLFLWKASLCSQDFNNTDSSSPSKRFTATSRASHTQHGLTQPVSPPNVPSRGTSQNHPTKTKEKAIHSWMGKRVRITPDPRTTACQSW